MQMIKNNIQLDSNLLTQLNRQLITQKKLTIISRKQYFQELVDFLVDELEKRHPQGVMKVLEVSIQICRQKLDHFNFYSVEGLISLYFQELTEQANQEYLGDLTLQRVRVILEEFLALK